MNELSVSLLQQPQSSFLLEAEPLYHYQPPIYRGREYTIYRHPTGIYARVTSATEDLFLPVRGHPKQLLPTHKNLHEYFSHCYFTTEQTSEGPYVRANEGIRGGMFTDQDQIPWYPGYALGHIIKKTEVVYPLLVSRRKRLQEQLDAKTNQYQLERRGFPPLDNVSKEKKKELDRFVAVAESELFRIEKDIEALDENISVIVEERSKSSPLRESLPIDYAKSPLVINHHSSEFEMMSHVLIQGQTPSIESLNTQVTSFVQSLLPNAMPSFLPADQVNAVVTGIKNALQNADGSISLVGSFVTLPVTRSLTIKFKDKATISQLLKNSATAYYVLSEETLGALFLGYGFNAKMKTTEKAKEVMSEISVFSFISYGKIPPLTRGSSLLEVYYAWHDALLKDARGGYPIAYRYRELTDVLKENGIS